MPGPFETKGEVVPAVQLELFLEAGANVAAQAARAGASREQVEAILRRAEEQGWGGVRVVGSQWASGSFLHYTPAHGGRMAGRRKGPKTGFSLRKSGDPGVAYLRLPTHPGGLVKMSRSIRLGDVLGQYKGPEIVLDFDARGVLVGIEVVG